MTSTSDTTKKKVFLIDDDRFLLNMYGMKFEKEGFEVTTSMRSQDALEKIRQGYIPDVIITDLILPGMDGIEFLDAVKKEKIAPEAITIVLSNQGQSSDIERAQQIGVNGYIVKAMTIPSEVLKEVMSIINEHKHE